MISIGCGLLWGVLWAPAAHAGSVQWTTTEPIFLDQITEKLDKWATSSRKPEVKRLLKTWSGLQSSQASGKVFHIEEVAGGAPRSVQWADHWRALEATALERESEQLLLKKNPQGAVAKARKAAQLWLSIHSEFPDSPYEKKHEDRVGGCELIEAQGWVQQKQYAKAMALFERAFVRMSSRVVPLHFSVARMEAFALACQKAMSATCAHWTLRLARMFPDGSVEKKTLIERLPYLSEIPTPEYGYRFNPLNYRAPDLDVKAFDEAFSNVIGRKYSAAIEKFEAFLKEFPRSNQRVRVLFWLGRLNGLERNQEKSRALLMEVLKEFPLTYYGILASLALGIPLDSVIEATLPKALTTDVYLTPSERARFERAREMWGSPWIGMDLNDFRARSSLSSPFLMYAASLASKAGNHLVTFNLLGDLIQRGYPGMTSSYVLRLIFPGMYRNWIQSAAEEEKIDPSLVISLIKQESAFDADVISGSGAMGLMQLMPFTAVEVDPLVEQRSVVDPKNNIRLGTRYLAQLIRKFGGNTVYALAGYNAGPGRVRSWRREPAKDGTPESDMLEFIETIPFSETRGYVSGIMRNYFWYTYLMSGKMMQSLTYFWGVSGPIEVPNALTTGSEKIIDKESGDSK